MATLNTLTFALNTDNGRYEHDAVEVGGDFGLALEFSTSLTDDANVLILASVDGTNYENVANLTVSPATHPVVQRLVTGIADGASVIISVSQAPESGAILA